jgi:hypothetical protein
MIISFVDPNDLTKTNVEELRSFLLRLGRETNQGEVGFVIDRQYFGYTQFEEE